MVLESKGFKPDPAVVLRTEPATPSRPIGFHPRQFTQADFAGIISRLSRNVAGQVADLAYGMRDPRFCNSDATAHALTFCSDVRMVLDDIERHAALVIEARQGRDAQQLDGNRESTAEGNAQ
jgi:hypothetical protein